MTGRPKTDWSEGEGSDGQSRVGWIRDQSWKKIRWCVLPRYQRRRACLGQSARQRSWILQLPRQRAETVAANDRRYSPCTSLRSHQEQAVSHQKRGVRGSV